jgi:hypothetical protein
MVWYCVHFIIVYCIASGVRSDNIISLVLSVSDTIHYLQLGEGLLEHKPHRYSTGEDAPMTWPFTGLPYNLDVCMRTVILENRAYITGKFWRRILGVEDRRKGDLRGKSSSPHNSLALDSLPPLIVDAC